MGIHALQALEDAAGSNGECAARGVLEHLVKHREAPPAFTVFLSANAPEEQESRLLSIVAQSLARRTLDVAFLPLGFKRRPPARSSDCERGVWRGVFGQGVPQGYLGARFLVSGARLLERPAEYVHHLVDMLDTPPGECKGDTAAVSQAFAPAWHTVFSEDPQHPLRADDARLPMFLRFEDGLSGFQGTKMPKTSTYLASTKALS